MKMSDRIWNTTVEAAEPSVAADVLGAAAKAQRDGNFERALELYLDAAAPAEVPPAELCLKIARCHDRLGSLDDASAWLTRMVDASDDFVCWSAASSALGRLAQRARPAARAACRVAVT